MTDTFEQLAENLSAAQKVEFLRVLNKHGITVESDTVVTCTAIALVFAVLGTWGFFYYWSERRIEEKRVYYLREISGNDRIVSELSESGRELILQNNYDGTKSLILESVIKGWTSIKNHGVIDFK